MEIPHAHVACRVNWLSLVICMIRVVFVLPLVRTATRVDVGWPSIHHRAILMFRQPRSCNYICGSALARPSTAHGHRYEETHQYHLEDVNGSLTTLSESHGFRNYVASRIRPMGLKGYIKRVPRRHAKLVVTGTP
eukprot:gene20113-14677_t